MPPRRTRQVAPAPVDDVALPADEPQDTVPAAFANPRRTRAQRPANDPEAPAAVTPAKRQARRVQAATADPKVRLPEDQRATEVADGKLMVPIGGRYFRLSETIGLMPLMEWVAAADEIDTQNTSTLISFYHVLQDLVHEDEWQEFRAFTREAKCDDDAFIAFRNAAMETLAARPTAEPATS